METKTPRKPRTTASGGSAKSPARARTTTRAKASPKKAVRTAPKRQRVPPAAPIPGIFPEPVAAVLKALSDKKIEDLCILKVDELVGYTDFFIIGTGLNLPHVQAMANAVTMTLKVPGDKGIPVEGLSTGQWVLVDAGDFVVHLFQPESRRFYALDDLWSDAPRLAYSDV